MKLLYKIRNIGSFIKKLRVWVPILWDDVDFDYHGVYEVIYQKLKQMEEFNRSDKTWAMYAHKTADEIKIAKNLAKRLVDDNYLENALFWYDKEYENNDYNMFEHSIDLGNGYSQLVPDPDKKRSAAFSKACADSEYSRNQDRKMLFAYMSKHIEKWWD